MEKDMDLGLFIIVKVVNMLEIGDKIKCMGKEYCTILTSKLPMMENGKMINFLAMELFTIKKFLH